MKLIDVILLFLLAAIWGASFIFMRVLVPELGPLMTAFIRTAVAGVALTAAFTIGGLRMHWRRNCGRFLIVGAFNSALPFALFSYAARSIPAAVSSVANALTPVWGAVFAAIILGEPLTARKSAGLALGIAGVILIAFRGGIEAAGEAGSAVLPILACVLASVSYGFSGSFIKRWAADVPSRAMTAASLLFAGILLLPLSVASPPRVEAVAAWVWLVAVAFSLLCSAIAYLIYFRLIATVGVTRALSVTLLIPVFAFLWGYLFLGEAIGFAVVAGATLVLTGTFIISGAAKRL